MLPNALPAQPNDHYHHQGSCYPIVNDALSPKIHAEGDGLQVCFPILELTYTQLTFCISHLKIMILFVWVWISAQSNFLSSYLLLKDLRNKPNFSIQVQMQVWGLNSGTHTWFLVLGFFSPVVSAMHTWKKCVMGIKAFSGMHATTSTLIASYSSKCWFWRRKCSKSNLPSSLNFKASL